jgi:hypothetical protein
MLSKLGRGISKTSDPKQSDGFDLSASFVGRCFSAGLSSIWLYSYRRGSKPQCSSKSETNHLHQDHYELDIRHTSSMRAKSGPMVQKWQISPFTARLGSAPNLDEITRMHSTWSQEASFFDGRCRVMNAQQSSKEGFVINSSFKSIFSTGVRRLGDRANPGRKPTFAIGPDRNPRILSAHRARPIPT